MPGIARNPVALIVISVPVRSVVGDGQVIPVVVALEGPADQVPCVAALSLALISVPRGFAFGGAPVAWCWFFLAEQARFLGPVAVTVGAPAVWALVAVVVASCDEPPQVLRRCYMG